MENQQESLEHLEQNSLSKLRRDSKDGYSYLAQLCKDNEQLKVVNAKLTKQNEELLTEKHSKLNLEGDSVDLSKSVDISQLQQNPTLLKTFAENEIKIKENQEITQELQIIAQITDKLTKALKESNENNISSEELQNQFEILIQNKAQELKLIEKLKTNLLYLESQQSQQMGMLKMISSQNENQESTKEIQFSSLNQFQNILLVKQQKCQNKVQMMSVKEALILSEEFLDFKLQQDLSDFKTFKDSSRMQSTPSCFLLFLKSQCSDKQSVYSKLSSFLNCLLRLYKENHQYGTFICQMLQIYTSDVIDNRLAQFIAKVNSEFKIILENKYQNQKNKQITLGSQLKREITSPFKSSGIDESGGEIPLIEVFDLLLNIFEKDLEVWQRVAELLCPKKKRTENYQLYIAC